MNSHLPTRLRAIRLYKELVRIGRDYPNPNYDFHGKLRRAFEKNRSAQGEDAERAIQLGEYIKQETLALYSLRKYRHLKNAYYSEDNVKTHNRGMESSRVESTLPYLPAELLYAIHILARNASLPVTSKHLYFTFKNAPSSVKARYLLGLADQYIAMELVTTHLTKILTYPICTQKVLQRYLGLLVPYYYVDPLDTQLPETQIPLEKLALQPGIQVLFKLPKRLFRNIVGDSKAAAQTTEFVKYLCSVPPVYRHLSRNIVTDIRQIEPFSPTPNLDAHDGYPLIRAVQSKHIPLVRLLLNYGAKPTKRGELAIFMAINQGDLELVRLLIDTADVYATQHMLKEAVKVNASDIVEWLVKAKGCVPDMKTLRLME